MLVTSLPMKRKVRLAHDVILTDTCAMHAGLVHDITGRDCLTQMAGHTVMLVTSLPMKSKVRLANDVILTDTCAKHAGLVQDITGRDCLTQNGRSHSHVFTTFKL